VLCSPTEEHASLSAITPAELSFARVAVVSRRRFKRVRSRAASYKLQPQEGLIDVV
jgi:hypothetical protein